ncbi:hypothetical protein Nepgr_003493 [Nepenthes gracilis]|uniref:Uncharacterized protein n=1 Tax=Nepenthes gracilis TaxID=150966 RepID=A0AAD3RZQ9_NEPGR|nr:hypothetical protein Nepgr_003493 [Nepenthes gracilis]
MEAGSLLRPGWCIPKLSLRRPLPAFPLLARPSLSNSQVDPQGVECQRVSPYLPDSAASELEWFWESLSAVTCCRSLVVVYDNNCILQIGVAAESSKCGEAEAVDVAKLIQGSLYQGIMNSGAQSYLTNLSLYPGKSELPFLPANAQGFSSIAGRMQEEAGSHLAVAGGKGILIIAGDTVRGFISIDQAWISLIGDKLDVTLSKLVPEEGRDKRFKLESP